MRRLEIAQEIPSYKLTEAAMSFAEELVAKLFVPEKAAGDAVHIAIAAMNGADYLLTWNCKHLANAEVEKKLAKFCLANGYELPFICMPLELMGDKDNL